MHRGHTGLVNCTHALDRNTCPSHRPLCRARLFIVQSTSLCKLADVCSTMPTRHNCYAVLPSIHRFVATGDSYFTIATAYRMRKSIVAKIVPETCSAIWDLLHPEAMPVPNRAKWKKTAREFKDFRQFPNCLGCIDGKHVAVQAPKNSGSLFFNYKKYFSMVLLAVSDAQYGFTLVDVGAYGKQSDANVFARSAFGKMLKQSDSKLQIPAKRVLPNTSGPEMPHAFVGDEAFPLLPNLMRPFPETSLSHQQRIFNYRLSRARKVVEYTFGIMVSRFRCLRRPLLLDPNNAEKVIKAIAVLQFL